MIEPIESLLDLLGSGGAGVAPPAEWRLSWSTWESSRLGVKDREAAGVHAPLTLSRGFALDYLFVWGDGRISTGSAETAALADPGEFVSLARQAAYDDPDGANILGPDEFPSVPLHSEEAAEEARSGGAKTFAALLRIAEEQATRRGFATWSGAISASAAERGVLTSRGLSARIASTLASYSFWYEGRMGDGDTSREPFGAGHASGRLERACDLVERLGEPDRTFEPGEIPVLLHPRVVESMLGAYIFSNLSAERIHHGQGAFRIEQFGGAERLFAPSLALRLEPLVPMDPGSYTFTTEGIPARPVSYIEGGRLIEAIADLKYARRLGRPAVPGPASPESYRFEGGRRVELGEALGGMRRGALVLSLLGLHTQDTTRGDFSVSAPLTLAVRDGSLGGGVKAVLSGNFFEVLRRPELGLVEFEGFRTPGLLFAGAIGLAPGAPARSGPIMP